MFTIISKVPGLNLSGIFIIYIQAPPMYKAPPSAQGKVSNPLIMFSFINNLIWKIGMVERSPQIINRIPLKGLNLG